MKLSEAEIRENLDLKILFRLNSGGKILKKIIKWTSQKQNLQESVNQSNEKQAMDT